MYFYIIVVSFFAYVFKMHIIKNLIYAINILQSALKFSQILQETKLIGIMGSQSPTFML